MKNKKRVIVILIIVSLFFLNSGTVYAAFTEGGSGEGVNCDGLLNEDAVQMIKEILNYFRVLAPIALIVFVALDFGQAVLSQDSDALKKATSKVVKRAIAAVALFFIPTIIIAIFDLVPATENPLVIPNDPFCNTLNTKIVEVDKI